MINLNGSFKDKLQDSPLFNLSLASKELFHSNFWYWYFNKNKEDAVIFFSRKTGKTLTNLTKIKREEKNIDLTLEFASNIKIFIENKIKSIPYKEQLDKYLKNKNEKDDLYLLSIYRPPNIERYNYIHYEELLDLLKVKQQKLRDDRKIITEQPEIEENYYLSGLYSDYETFLSHLLKLTNEWEKEEKFDFYSTYPGKTNRYKTFQELRIHDLFHKVKYNQLKHQLHDNTKNRLSPKEQNSLESFDYFSHGTGAASLWYYLRREEKVDGKTKLMGENIKKDIRVELQIQDSMFRLMLIAENCATFKDKIVDSKWIYKIFEFIYESEIIEVTESQIYPKNNNFNQYGRDIIYKNKKIKNGIDLNSLVEKMSTFFIKVINYAEVNKEMIKEELDIHKIDSKVYTY